jgi:hypothetical protein
MIEKGSKIANGNLGSVNRMQGGSRIQVGGSGCDRSILIAAQSVSGASYFIGCSENSLAVRCEHSEV